MHTDLTIPALDVLEDIAAELARTAQLAADRSAAAALNKAAHHLPTIHAVLRFSAGDLLIPSATHAGQVYRVSGAGCSCEAGAHGRQCWHAAIAEVVLVARDRLAEADDGDGNDYETYQPDYHVDEEPFLCAGPLSAPPAYINRRHQAQPQLPAGDCSAHGPYAGDHCPRCAAQARRLVSRLTAARARVWQVAA